MNRRFGEVPIPRHDAPTTPPDATGSVRSHQTVGLGRRGQPLLSPLGEKHRFSAAA